MSSHKRQVFDELILEVRRSQNATDRFDQAVADALGLNRTDLRIVDTLEREGPVPAGRLAAATGLTSGAITAALDRLERSGFVRRVRDEQDRRRVLVELEPDVLSRSRDFFDEHLRLSERIYERHTAQELELLLRFVREGRELNERQAELLERQVRERR